MFPLRDTVPSRHLPVATWAILGTNLLVFLYQALLPEALERRMVYLFGVVPARFSHPEWADAAGFPDSFWPFLTSLFLHGGVLHLLSNLWTLFIFGDNVEDRMGPVRYLVFYFLCGLAAGGLHQITHPDSTVPTIGASGAIAGVLGAYLRLYPHARVLTLVPVVFIPFFFYVPAFVFLGIWFLTQLLGTFSVGGGAAGGIAWWAHVGGFLAGLLLCPLFLGRREPPPDLLPGRHYFLPDGR